MNITCSTCLGTGTVGGEDCHSCEGSGMTEASGTHTVVEAHVIAMYAVVVDLVDKVNDIFNKCNDIFEQVNTP